MHVFTSSVVQAQQCGAGTSSVVHSTAVQCSVVHNSVECGVLDLASVFSQGSVEQLPVTSSNRTQLVELTQNLRQNDLL